ncbi:MAG: TlpA family protein disulfide reductase [Oscillospiraceae bacterium]|nr:TlpA family protein disulfide reductase [Oscillospiraceae bacterium]
MKRFCILLAALLLAPALAACGKGESAPAAPAQTAELPALRFSTTDRAGNAVDESVLQGHRLVMLNFWEPWCPPCVREMPDLEKLYEDYKDRGLLILGIYSTEGQEADVDRVLSDSATSYPILHYSKDFEIFQTGYVPTTVFVDGEGKILSELLVGGRDYAGWEELIGSSLK